MSRRCPEIIIQRDDGLWSIGFGDDAPGPFETREFALSVAGGPARRPYSFAEEGSPAIPFRKINYRRARVAQSSA
jgi:hypothetical protein